MVLIAWGEVLGVYDSWTFYDNVVHFTVPLLVTGMIYVLLVRLGVLPELSDLKQVHQNFGFFLTALMLGMAIGAGWEIIEWSLDEWAGANLVGSATDTATDLIWDTMGATGSAIILIALEPRRPLAETPARGRAREQAVRELLDASLSTGQPGELTDEGTWSSRRYAISVEINRLAPVVGSSEIEIAAAPEVAWDVLTAIGRWPSWNPTVTSVSFEGEIDPGSAFRWKAGPGTITSTIRGRRAAAPDRLDGHVVRNQGDPRAHLRAARRRDVGDDRGVLRRARRSAPSPAAPESRWTARSKASSST